MKRIRFVFTSSVITSDIPLVYTLVQKYIQLTYSLEYVHFAPTFRTTSETNMERTVLTISPLLQISIAQARANCCPCHK